MKTLRTRSLRLTALALSLITIVFSFFACSSMGEGEGTTGITPVVETNANGEQLSALKIGYTQSDTLSPFTAQGTAEYEGRTSFLQPSKNSQSRIS